MKRCTRCGCAGRRESVAERGGVSVAQCVCANPRCSNYKIVFAEEELENEDEKKEVLKNGNGI